MAVVVAERLPAPATSRRKAGARAALELDAVVRELEVAPGDRPDDVVGVARWNVELPRARARRAAIALDRHRHGRRARIRAAYRERLDPSAAGIQHGGAAADGEERQPATDAGDLHGDVREDLHGASLVELLVVVVAALCRALPNYRNPGIRSRTAGRDSRPGSGGGSPRPGPIPAAGP